MANLNSLLAKLATIFNSDSVTGNPTQIKAANIATGTPTYGFVPIAQADGTVAWGAQSGGGGGGAFTSIVAIWTSTASNIKNAYTSPGVVNGDGITITFTAAFGSGGITTARVSLNGTQLTNTYNSTGAWPTLELTIPLADISTSPAQTAAQVTVSVVGSFNGGNFNTPSSDIANLVNRQPIAFSGNTTGRYLSSSYPYYITSDQVRITGSYVGSITSFAGTQISDGVNTEALTSVTSETTTASFLFANTTRITGNVSGSGQQGAGSTTLVLNSLVPTPTSYTPAFYTQTANSTIPTFTTNSNQTSDAAAGSTITYPLASATTQYDWVAVPSTIPLSRILYVTSIGSSTLVPDVTGAQTIAGTAFSVYGFTNLTVGSAATLLIST